MDGRRGGRLLQKQGELRFSPTKRLGREQSLEGAAREAEKMVEQKAAEPDERSDDEGGGKGMNGRHPREPHGKEIFSKTQNPIAKRFGAGVDGGARAGFFAMRRESDSAGEQRRAPAPFRGSCPGGRESEQGGSGRSDKSVDGVPESVEARDFVRQEFQQIERDGNSKDPGMRKNLQSSRQMKHAEALEQPKRSDGGVKIETRRNPAPSARPSVSMESMWHHHNRAEITETGRYFRRYRAEFPFDPKEKQAILVTGR